MVLFFRTKMKPQLSIYENKMLKREKKSVGIMVKIYCKDHHKARDKVGDELCSECSEYKAYMFKHLERCPFREKKSACGRCLRCYPPSFGEKAFEVMGSAGPKMFLHHPILALKHLWDARIEPDSTVKVFVF
jgi:Nitrous oxide-stimulated promoter